MNRPYDKNKIGKFISWGGEHLVYEYGKSQVIKFSLHIWLSGKKAVEKKKKDYKIGQKYFDKYLLPVEILSWKKGKRAVEIQNKIQCRFLRKKDLRDDKIKKQFNDIIKRHQRMTQDRGIPMDFIGREGLLKFWKNNEISNILVTPEKKLVLIDFTLLELKPKIRELPLWLLIQGAKRRQKKLLANFMEYVQNTCSAVN